MSAAKNKILLVTPPYHSGIPEISGRWLPLGLVYLAGAAREAGVEAEIYDAMATGDGYPEIERRMGQTAPRYVATGAMTATVGDALKVLAAAKALDPTTVTILGGVHPSFMYREILESPAAVDYVVIGEGEQKLTRLLRTLEQGGDPAGVPGLAYREGGEVKVTPAAPLIEDLDALAPAWDLVDWPLYSYFVIPDSRFAAIGTSRGCSHDCAFCSQQRFWGKAWRARDPLKVAAEVAELHRRYGVNVFLVTDEHPTRDADRWERFLDALIELALPTHLILETRAEDVVRDRDIFWKYAKAGVVHISLGIESADRQVLERLGKGMEPDAAPEALSIIHAHGVVSEASFIVGFPDETPESVRATLKTAQRYNPDNANFFALTPWPYGGMPELKPLIREFDYSRYNFIDPVLEPESMSLKELQGAINDCYRRFYMGKMLEVMTMKDTFRRGYLVRATKLIMSSSFVIGKLNPWGGGR
ncbi:B12-binding domain-containing radical SAM protein [Geomonas azotofigens]|uniref:B12-binding domain-containing radical SAM protein n=1 Tax=Geomonas azotofigens TaxID=2843196 RepID=UPI001C11AADF|nr:radical SAM protein [Geomonas azotofigens]MBU5615430.1 B12-binding domain-containing radical SAM protein [Geomonas azotofigens]